ncbi:MAG TPA: S9 family peptidase [Pyrinomonadaceae bacterium]|nr:S9 family peptidase [Pyrinomonadaceae bacterium]
MNRNMIRFLVFSVILGCASAMSVGQTGFTFDNMINFRRVGDPQLAPDGRRVAYTVGVVNKADNRTLTHIHIVNLDGSNPRQLTRGNTSHSSPRWSPDGRKIAYVTGGQIWTMDPDGGNDRQVTRISTGAGNPVWSPDGRWIAFVSDVYPECATDACNKAEDEKVENSKVKAKVAERLLFKHWNEWRDRKRTHVFVVASEGGIARDLTPGDYDSPPYSASTGHDYAFSPDSSEIAFLRNPDPVEATSTNSDIFVIRLNGGEPRNITVANKGYDVSPYYTSDGRYMLYRSQATPTFEADRWRIMRYDRRSGETVELTRGFDQQADDLLVSSDNRTVYFTAVERGRSRVFTVPLEPDFRQRIATHVKQVGGSLTSFPFITNISLTPDARTLVFLTSSLAAPAEVYASSLQGTAITSLSKTRSNLNLLAAEEVTWRGALQTPIHGFLVKPINFDASRKYPLLVLIHGGPQSAWNDTWSWRWNAQVFANAGYVVFLPNPRGSTGYGQKFVDEISGDWGGKVFVDIKNGVAEILKRQYIDRNRIGGAGASYGGYMVNWILGHNNDPRFKFKTLVSHAGVYNLESMATSTEEIFFVNWEFKGMPWQNPVNYQRWSPNKFVNNFSTPTLVTAGELDYRVPVDQSLQLFTSLQLKNVPSKLIIFPDEGHWILKPQNSEFWYSNVITWLDKYLK